MPKVILGITGGIATGKSEALKQFKRHGFKTISSDDLAHRCVKKGHPAYRSIVRNFGVKVLSGDGQIDRKVLGGIVFANSRLRKKLERIVHPCVRAGLIHFIRQHKNQDLALDIPLLYEAKYQPLIDKVMVIYSTQAQQIQRLARRNGLSRRQAIQRIKSQMPLARKCRLADSVIRNTGSLGRLKIQINQVLLHLKKA